MNASQDSARGTAPCQSTSSQSHDLNFISLADADDDSAAITEVEKIPRLSGRLIGKKAKRKRKYLALREAREAEEAAVNNKQELSPSQVDDASASTIVPPPSKRAKVEDKGHTLTWGDFRKQELAIEEMRAAEEAAAIDDGNAYVPPALPSPRTMIPLPAREVNSMLPALENAPNIMLPPTKKAKISRKGHTLTWNQFQAQEIAFEEAEAARAAEFLDYGDAPVSQPRTVTLLPAREVYSMPPSLDEAAAMVTRNDRSSLRPLLPPSSTSALAATSLPPNMSKITCPIGYKSRINDVMLVIMKDGKEQNFKELETCVQEHWSSISDPANKDFKDHSEERKYFELDLNVFMEYYGEEVEFPFMDGRGGGIDRTTELRAGRGLIAPVLVDDSGSSGAGTESHENDSRDQDDAGDQQHPRYEDSSQNQDNPEHERIARHEDDSRHDHNPQPHRYSHEGSHHAGSFQHNQDANMGAIQALQQEMASLRNEVTMLRSMSGFMGGYAMMSGFAPGLMPQLPVMPQIPAYQFPDYGAGPSGPPQNPPSFVEGNENEIEELRRFNDRQFQSSTHVKIPTSEQKEQRGSENDMVSQHKEPRFHARPPRLAANPEVSIAPNGYSRVSTCFFWDLWRNGYTEKSCTKSDDDCTYYHKYGPDIPVAGPPKRYIGPMPGRQGPPTIKQEEVDSEDDQLAEEEEDELLTTGNKTYKKKEEATPLIAPKAQQEALRQLSLFREVEDALLDVYRGEK